MGHTEVLAKIVNAMICLSALSNSGTGIDVATHQCVLDW